MIEGLRLWNEIAEDEGISKAALSYRWVVFNSQLKKELGDGMIIGAMKPESLEQTVGWLKDGPLDARVAKRVDEVWKIVESEAAYDNFNK